MGDVSSMLLQKTVWKRGRPQLLCLHANLQENPWRNVCAETQRESFAQNNWQMFQQTIAQALWSMDSKLN